MDHTEAVETLAPERYLLNEMTDEDRDAFEDHFFDCIECAADLRAGTALIAGVREEGKAQRRPRPWTAWSSNAAAAMLIAVVGYQNGVVIPRMARERDEANRPRLLHLSSKPLSTSMSRSGPETVVVHGDVLSIEVEPVEGATGYVLEVVGPGEVKQFVQRVTAAEATETVYLLPPGGKLPPGRYTLKVKPEGAGQPSSKQFVVS